MNMLRWVILAVIGYIVCRLISKEIRARLAKGKQTVEKNARNEPAGTMIKDPVCGVYVDAASCISMRDGAQVHRFCSYACRDSFLEQRRLKRQNTQEGAKKEINQPPEETPGCGEK